jgi:ATP-binding cassette, subfamily B, bacterial PglK
MFLDLYSILNSKEKIKLNIIILLNSLVFFLEFFSLISIPIFVSLLFNKEFLINKLNNYYNVNILEYINIDNIILLSSIAVIIFFFLKNFFLIFLSYLQGLFFKDIKIRLSKALFSFYIYSPYLHHVQNNPSKLSRNISDEIQGLYTYIFHLINLFRESLAILVIFAILLIADFYLTILISFFFLILSFFYTKFMRPQIKNRSKNNQDFRNNIIQTINEAFGSIKDLKILRKEKEIINFFQKDIIKLESNLFYFSIFERLPRIFLELLSIIIIIITSAIYLNLQKDYNSLLPILALLVVAVVRFMPAFNGIILSIYYMRIFKLSVQLIFKEIKLIANFNESNLKLKNSKDKNFYINTKKSFLLIQNVSFSYVKDKISPINNINFDIKEGSKVAIIGRTGSGKSTLFHLMLGFLEPSKGDIFYKNESIYKNIDKWRKEIGYISQNIYLLDSSIKKNITFNFFNETLDEKRLERALVISNLKDKISKLPEGLNTRVGNDGLKLSGGEKQRIAIARAVYKNPKILFMDESTSALDVKTEEEIIKNLNKFFYNKTIVIAAHRKSIIKNCDKILDLDNKYGNKLFN